MATSALRELQMACVPAAIGTISAIYSNIMVMGIVGKVRYADKSVQVHPYKPWSDTSEMAEAHFRAYKASINCIEWTGYFVPLLWLYAIYVPALPLPPVAVTALHWSGALLGLAFGHQNVKYVEGYTQSASARLGPFRRRANIIRLALGATCLGLAATASRALGVFA
mmetsp:Transcript_6670/g.21404  ORF Transcript_6670/g.21404 Transcript_6670/m.21404 type:complete len:167 (-) Transcript_6670:136-636(-)